MVSFGFGKSATAGPCSSQDNAPETSTQIALGGLSAPSNAEDKCPVDHETRNKWLAANPGASHPFKPANSPSPPNSAPSGTAGPSTPRSTSADGSLSAHRVISSIPRASTSFPSPEGSIPVTPGTPSTTPYSGHNPADSGNEKEEKWVYPSEQQFFQAMLRKNHNPKVADMRTVVPIHNAVNEKAWEQVLEWEGSKGDRCGGPRLISFAGRPKDMTPKAWIKSICGYSTPFDRHDWLIDRCGTQIRYVIDFYSGKPDPQNPQKMSFYLDVRPALDDWESIKTRMGGWVKL